MSKQEWHGEDRRSHPQLTDEQMELIAERAAEKAVAKMTAQMYQHIGKGVLDKLFLIVGICAVGFAAWLNAKGFLK